MDMDDLLSVDESLAYKDTEDSGLPHRWEKCKFLLSLINSAGLCVIDKCAF